MQSNRVQWLDRRISAHGPFLTLCLDEEQFKKACKQIKCAAPPFLPNAWSDAAAHYFDTAFGLVVIVCLQGWQGRNPIEVAGILVHEAVHVWQKYAERIGESNPGREQEAYAIQAVSQELMDSFSRQVNGSRGG